MFEFNFQGPTRMNPIDPVTPVAALHHIATLQISKDLEI